MKKVTYEFDPFELADVEPPKSASKRRQAMEEIGKYVVGEIHTACADGKTPVAGGSWERALSEGYKKQKQKDGGQGFANLELTGSLMDSVDYSVKSDTIEVGVWGSEAPKADGHNNFSGESKLPPREFIPNDDRGQTFKRDIVRGIRQIAEEFSDDGDV
jgi:hypothetical protein